MAGLDRTTGSAWRSRDVTADPAHLRRVIGGLPNPALLGGNAGTGPQGRWTILAACPRLVVESPTGADYRIVDDAGRLVETGTDALVGLDDLMRRFGLGGASFVDLAPDRWGTDPTDLPFLGGLIGLLSYDLAPRLERLPRRHDRPPTVPAVRFGLYDTFILINHLGGEAHVWAVDLLHEGSAALEARLDSWMGALARPSRPLGSIRLGPVRPDQTPDQFRAGVARAREYLAAGDIFQVNLAQRFKATGEVDPLALDARLLALSPAPYSAYLAWDDRAIISASPELFYKTQTWDGTIWTRPIKGTRPRRADPQADAAQVADLLASPKDAAELAMIVDLERNDLGRVCQFGSVRVVEARAVETHPTVHHTVATVAGRLRREVGPIDVIRALFPGGSITGAPKIRAMEIIDELEPCLRGIYTGAIGFWSRHGRSCFNITIRTVVVAGSEVSYHVGGGIVIDSDPEREYQETLHKGRALRAALEGDGPAQELRG